MSLRQDKGSLLLGVMLRGPDPTSHSVPTLLSDKAQQNYLRLQSSLRRIMQIPESFRIQGIVSGYQEMINEAYAAFRSLRVHDIPAQNGHSLAQLRQFRAGLQDMKNLQAVSQKCRTNNATVILKQLALHVVTWQADYLRPSYRGNANFLRPSPDLFVYWPVRRYCQYSTEEAFEEALLAPLRFQNNYCEDCLIMAPTFSDLNR